MPLVNQACLENVAIPVNQGKKGDQGAPGNPGLPGAPGQPGRNGGMRLRLSAHAHIQCRFKIN